MAFQFKKTEPPARALRRVGREHLRAAQDCLRKSRHPASVHGVRKEIKKLRALFQLVRGEIGRGTYRKAAKGLRRVAGLLAATRDARVRFKAFEQLAGRHAARRFPFLPKALLKDYRREARRFWADDSVARAKRVLAKTGKRVAGLKFAAPRLGGHRAGPEAELSARRPVLPAGATRADPRTFSRMAQAGKKVRLSTPADLPPVDGSHGHDGRQIGPTWPMAGR